MKRRTKRNVAILGTLSLALFLGGCTSNAPITSHSTGFWDHYIIWNFVRAIQWLSNFFGHNYGWGIVVFTIIVRIIILPLMFYQMKSMRKTQEIQPKLMALQKKYPGKDPESMQKLSEEQQKLYAEAGINPMAGCLPMLIQMPILIALYQAIWRSPILKNGDFLWMHLGEKDPYYIMPILAAIFTFLTSKLSMMGQPEGINNMMNNMMLYFMPIMTGFIAFNLPSALSIYWVVTNAFSVGQTLLLQNPFKIRREREEKEAAEKARKKRLEKAKRKAYKSKRK